MQAFECEPRHPADIDDEETTDGTAHGVSKKKDVKKEVFEWIKSIALAAVCAFLIVRYVFSFTVVDGRSMFPTLHDGDRLVELKFEKWYRDFQRGDIVVFKDAQQTSGDYYVKRILAVAGDRIQIRDGEVFVNSEKLREAYIASEHLETEGDLDLVVPEGHVFVLGDNREHSASLDSRRFGPVKVSSIAGRCVLRVYPFSRIGTLH